jgi:hypothetical protein
MAYGPLFTGRGSCKNYSAATYFMLRYIGLPGVQRPVGYVMNRSGKIQFHKWNTVTLGGCVYLVDAQIEGTAYNRSGRVAYTYFFKTLGDYFGTTPVYFPTGLTSEAGGRLQEQLVSLLGDPAGIF